jgi:hypothetical protein
MSATKTGNPARKISISLPVNYIEILDQMNGTRSKIIREALETLFDTESVEYMEYFFNALHGQIHRSKVMDTLTKSSIEKFLRKHVGVNPEEDLWNVVPAKVRNWCHAFILPLEDSVSELSDEERRCLMGLAKKRLGKLLEWENSQGYY